MCPQGRQLALIRYRRGFLRCGGSDKNQRRKGQSRRGQPYSVSPSDPCERSSSAPEKLTQSLFHDLSAYFGDGLGQRNVLRADFDAGLRGAAFLDPAVAHQRRQSLVLERVARRVRIKQLHLRDSGCAHKARFFIELRASLHAATAGNAARQRISPTLLLWRHTRPGAEVVRAVDRNPSLDGLQVLENHAAVRRQIANDRELRKRL